MLWWAEPTAAKLAAHLVALMVLEWAAWTAAAMAAQRAVILVASTVTEWADWTAPNLVHTMVHMLVEPSGLVMAAPSGKSWVAQWEH